MNNIIPLKACKNSSLSLLACMLAMFHASGQTLSWHAPFAGELTTAANWNPAQVPSSGSALVFNNEATGTMTLASDLNVASLLLDNGPNPLVFALTGREVTLGGSGVNFTANNGSIATFENGTLTTGAFRTFTGSDIQLTFNGTQLSTATVRTEAAGTSITLQNGAVLESTSTADSTIGNSATTHHTLEVTATAGTGAGLQVRRGVLEVTGVDSLVDITRDLQITTNSGSVEFNSGTIATRTLIASNNAALVVGDGTGPTAHLLLRGPGTSEFPNGLVIASNGRLSINNSNISGSISASGAGAELILARQSFNTSS